VRDFAALPAYGLQQLIANAKALGDERLAQQASLLSLTWGLSPAMVRLDAVYRGSKNREERRVSKDIANDISTVRCNMALLATLTMDGKFKTSSGPGQPMQEEMVSEYATLPNSACPLDAQPLLSDVRRLLDSSRSACQVDLEQSASLLASWARPLCRVGSPYVSQTCWPTWTCAPAWS